MTFTPTVKGHLLGLAIVSSLFIAAIVLTKAFNAFDHERREHGIERYLALPGLDFGDPAERALFRETMRVFHPRHADRMDSLAATLTLRYQERFSTRADKSGTDLTGLTLAKTRQVFGMYIQFVLAYAIVMMLVAAAGERLGIGLFIRREQRRHDISRGLALTRTQRLTDLLLALGTFLAFAPAYVIAYALKTRFDTSNLVFLLLLGIFSNGVLVASARRFYTLLVTESRKGYVENAIVHSLHDSYTWGTGTGLSRAVLWSPLRHSEGHVFQHIVANAQFQSLTSLKEQASFVITGLVIIEMALNLQGRLCYELLQNMLYHQYDVVIAIVLGIFWLVKGTEIFLDERHARKARRYDNR